MFVDKQIKVLYWLRLSRQASMYMVSSGLVEAAPLKMPATDAGETSGTHDLRPRPTSPEDTMYIKVLLTKSIICLIDKKIKIPLKKPLRYFVDKKTVLMTSSFKCLVESNADKTLRYFFDKS